MSKIAIVRIAGDVGKSGEINSTLKMLNLKRKFSCSVLENTKANMGMVKKVKDFATYGEIGEDTLKVLQQKRGKKNKKFFSLHPPIKGFERKGTKKSFKEGGALGYRGEKINDLLKRMI